MEEAMKNLNGAELIIQLLEHHGITTIAGIPGGANLPLYDALSKSSSIRHILARHEQGAGFIAHGIARSTGKPGVCFATSGPGATNIVTAIADAYLDSIPLICITGQVAGSLIGTDAFQEVDTYGMSIPVTKYNFLIRTAHEIPDTIRRAFEIAMEGRPGPVLIDVPKDIQLEEVSVTSLYDIEKAPLYPPCAGENIHKAAAMINSAKRPILYLGGGIINSGAADVARNMAEKSSIPVTTSLMGLGSIASNHPLCMGMLGMHAARSTNLALAECDLLIAAGVRFDDRATGKISEFCPQAEVIHMDIDPSEVDKLKESNVALIGDVQDCLSELIPFIHQRNREAWHDRIGELKMLYPLTTAESLVPPKPYGIISKIAEIAGDDAIIATDVGKHQMWAAQVYPVLRPRQFLTSGGLGTMGFGLPTAIGASVAHPDRIVICFTGDGSLQMNIQELATAVELQANVKIILLNNNSLGLVRQQQGLFYNGNHFASDYMIDIDFAVIAKGFGMKSLDLKNIDTPEEHLEKALTTPGPYLVNIPIAKDEEVYPMVPPGAANTTMIGGYYSELKN